MKSIGFLTPYKHLPKFKEYVESKFICREITGPVPDNVDYLFCAPNYARFTITDRHIKGTAVKAILTPSTGTNHINVSIPVYSIKNDLVLKSITSTAEHNIYLMLAINRAFEKPRELSKCTLGILGYGRLGVIVDRIGENLFKKVLKKDLELCDTNFFEHTDFLSINIDYNIDNIKYVNREFVSQFKKPIFIVNTSRGEVVDEKEIVELINEGKILGYATDVVTGEHIQTTPYLYTVESKKIIITPHVGGTTIDAQEVAYKEVLKKII